GQSLGAQRRIGRAVAVGAARHRIAERDDRLLRPRTRRGRGRSRRGRGRPAADTGAAERDHPDERPAKPARPHGASLVLVASAEMASLSVVVPHWPIDEEVDAALQRCLSSFPSECERIVVVNDGTGYARNVNTGLRLAGRDFAAVVNNGCWVDEGDVYDLCVPETVTSPLVIGRRQGFGESIEPGGFHGCFWVVPRDVLDRVGLLDERFERAYFEDDDLL